MGKCCGATKSKKKVKESVTRQHALEDMGEGSNVPPPPPLDDAPSFGAPPPPPGKGKIVVPSWKAKMEVRLTDEYSEMVLAKDDFKPGGGDYKRGTVPGVDQDESSRGQPFSKFSKQDKATVAIAQEVLGNVRASLPLGPFNNYKALPQEVLERQNFPGTDEHCPAWWNQVVDAAAEMAVDQLKNKLKDVPEFKLSMACLARATKEVGGGVCSKMATMTAGELTTSLPPGSQIAQVFSGFDHEFVVAKTPGSRWFVVDPWCHEPLTVPFVDCSFNPESVEKFIIIEVTKPAPKGQPFGIDVETDVDWPDIIKQAKASVKPTTKDMSHVFGQTANVKGVKQFDPKLGSVGKGNWG